MASKPSLLHKVKQKFADLKVRTKIMVFYCTLQIFSVLLSAFIYQTIYNFTISKKVSDVSLQTLYSISSNIDSIIENARNLTTVISTSNEIQQPLREKSQKIGEADAMKPHVVDTNDRLDSQRSINAHVSRFIGAFPFISSIYIFDGSSQRYGIDKMPLKALSIKHIEDAFWYRDALAAQGGFILKLNAGGIFNDSPGEKYVSLIRIINDIYSQKPTGVIILNITQEAFANCYKDILNKYDIDIMIEDQAGQTIVDFRHTRIPDIHTLFQSDSQIGSSVLKKLDKQDYLITRLTMDKYSWNIVSTMLFQELSKESNNFNVITLGIIAFNATLLIFGFVIISRLITRPIKKLLVSMKGVEKGEFKKVHIDSGNDEIGKLRDAYNIMIVEIQNLIHKVVEDQKLKRMAELDVLQAQIRPHFLYNTFDAISALALSGQNEEVYKVMKALGSYYRVSLSKGREIITLSEELEVVRNYMAIQKVRYGDVFTMHYDIDESAMQYKILKLVLQPLVENALYHGIKPKGEHGNIRLSVRHVQEFLQLVIEDDGIGMSQDIIARILESRYQGGTSNSFGLLGTIERLRIFYGINEPITIESVPYEGTRIIISIPLEGLS